MQCIVTFNNLHRSVYSVYTVHAVIKQWLLQYSLNYEVTTAFGSGNWLGGLGWGPMTYYPSEAALCKRALGPTAPNRHLIT